MTSREPYATQGIQVVGKSGGTLQYTAMLFVIPQSQSAIALLCAGHMDAVKTTLPIVDALLMETERLPPESKKVAPKSLEAVAFSPDIGSYDGYYACDAGIFKIDLNSQSSTLETSAFNGSTFIHTSSARHMGGGVFENPQGEIVAFETLLGVPSLMKVEGPYDLAQIEMTRLDETMPYFEHEFREGYWLPTNLLPHDLYMQVYETKFIGQLPSYLIVTGMTTTPYAITGSRRTSMTLPALRDQTPPWIADDGSLMVGAYQCMNHSDVLPLVSGKTVQIANAGVTSLWRRVTEHGTLSCEIPDGGRIIILGPDFRVLEDTLYSKQNRIDREVYGSYVGFIAMEQGFFNPTLVLFD
jgi:hypothetical protein